MQFLSVSYIFFLVMVLCIWYIVPGKYQYLVILAANVFFYSSWVHSLSDALLLILLVILAYGAAICIAGCTISWVRITVLWSFVVTSAGLLLYFKYFAFLIENINNLQGLLGIQPLAAESPIAPVGLSFFSFQSLGYVIDVYRGKSGCEKNLLRYAAFASFFATITSGPIERSDHFLKELQFAGKKKPEYEKIRSGAILFLYGAFVKMVISDRLSVVSNTVFGAYENYSGFLLMTAAIGYSLQIYCDFMSYSLLAQGSAKMMGLELIENFKAPYFSESVQEFWRRWHISLSTWLRDYVYISLGGNRCSKVRKDINIFITFLISGLWHGANWTFVMWGCLHGIFQIVGNRTRKFRNRVTRWLQFDTTCFSAHLWRKFFVWVCVSLAWIFFRSATISDAFMYIYRMFTLFWPWDVFNQSLYTMGLDELQVRILFLALLVLIALDYRKYKTDKNIDVLLLQQNPVFRGLCILALFLATFVFGQYGPAYNAQEFIYFQF